MLNPEIRGSECRVIPEVYARCMSSQESLNVDFQYHQLITRSMIEEWRQDRCTIETQEDGGARKHRMDGNAASMPVTQRLEGGVGGQRLLGRM